MTISFINSYLRIRNLKKGTTFYASDLGLSGGSIGGLRWQGFIEPTGNVKTYTIPHPYNDKMLIKCEVKEWRMRVNTNYCKFWDKQVKDQLALAEEVVELAKQCNF